MNRISCALLALLLTGSLAACGGKPAQFAVTMTEAYAKREPITLTVTLPEANESGITFAVDGTVYAVASMPVTDAPAFVFADIADDGMQSVRLELASDESEDVVLCMLPDGEEFELCFCAPLGEFQRLYDYLASN